MPLGRSYVRRECHKLWPAALLALTLLASSGIGSAQEQDILQQLQGSWAGAAGDGANSSGANRVAMDWTPDKDGFDLRWSVPGAGVQTAQFRRTDRPQVYVGDSGQGWAMFDRRPTVNPLEKGTLLWARTAPDAVYVYSLSIDDRGAFVLDRYRCQPQAGTLLVSFLRQLPGRQEQFEAVLRRIVP